MLGLLHGVWFERCKHVYLPDFVDIHSVIIVWRKPRCQEIIWWSSQELQQTDTTCDEQLTDTDSQIWIKIYPTDCSGEL